MTTDDTREPGASTSPLDIAVDAAAEAERAFQKALDDAQADYDAVIRRLSAKLDEYRADNERLRAELDQRERLYASMDAADARHGAQIELQRDQLLTTREHLGVSKQIVASIAVQNDIVKNLTRAIEHLCDVARLVAGRM
jgi:chromosome segregation ATPase